MARNIVMKLMAVGKINGVSPNFIPLKFNTCIKNSKHLYFISKYIF